MQCACAVLSSVTCLALQYFPALYHDFRKNVIERKMCVLIFSTTFVWNISHFRKRWARYDHKCVLVFMWSTRFSCQILTESRQIFEKYSCIKFHENPSSRSRVIPCGRTGGQTWWSWYSLFASSRKHPRRLKNCVWLSYEM